MVDRALAWLAKDDTRPFFLWVHLYDAHAPYTPPPAWRARHPGRPYDGEVSAVDEQVGRILEELRRRGLDGSTVVAVAADHGEGLGEHGELTHGLLLYEPTLHVPLLLRAPWGLKARVVEAPVSLVDLAPTLAGLLGHPFPAAAPLDGRDLSRALLAGGEPAAGEIYAETRYPAVFGWSPLAALRRRDLKYISGSAAGALRPAPRSAGEANLLRRGRTAPEARGFAARLAAIEASAVTTARPLAARRRDPRQAGEPRLRRRRRRRQRRRPSRGGRAGAAATDPRTMVDLFQRFEKANARLTRRRPRRRGERARGAGGGRSRQPGLPRQAGAAWRERGETAKALPLYRQAAAAAPRDPEAWYNLASALQEAGQPARRGRRIERALQLDAGRPEAHNTLGHRRARGREPGARRGASSQTAVALDPRDAARLQQPRQRPARRSGKLDEAASAYQRSAALAPRYAEPLNGLGTLEVERDRPRRHFLSSSALWLSPRDTTRSGSTGPSPRSSRATPDAALSAYREFLAATAGDPKFSEQRRAAQQLLARLESRTRGAAPAERR